MCLEGKLFFTGFRCNFLAGLGPEYIGYINYLVVSEADIAYGAKNQLLVQGHDIAFEKAFATQQ